MAELEVKKEPAGRAKPTVRIVEPDQGEVQAVVPAAAGVKTTRSTVNLPMALPTERPMTKVARRLLNRNQAPHIQSTEERIAAKAHYRELKTQRKVLQKAKGKRAREKKMEMIEAEKRKASVAFEHDMETVLETEEPARKRRRV
ncbi:hypothetical protein DIPPA_22883 [Diplonema papillatum]|nr:hypothetical protein DIPPA_22883 [Diplonema papillatum]